MEGNSPELWNMNPRTLVVLVVVTIITSCALAFLLASEPWKTGDIDRDDAGGSNTSREPDLNARVASATSRALAWTDTLDVDPVALREEMGIPGKKTYVELLDIYYHLDMTTASPPEHRLYRDRVVQLMNLSRGPGYHNLREIPVTEFRQDSTSYLRAWFIFDHFGLDSSEYRREIQTVLPRIQDDLPNRGINQRMAFSLYLTRLGTGPGNETMEDLFNSSVTRTHTGFENFSDTEVYVVTHEVMFLHDGDMLHLLTPADTRYLRAFLDHMLVRSMERNNIDLLAELCMVTEYINATDLPSYPLALDFILDRQNENGSFGDYERYRGYYLEKDPPRDVDYLFTLHTTETCLIALNTAVAEEHR
jgi:hypothetical protein